MRVAGESFRKMGATSSASGPERQQRDVETRLEDELLDRVDGKLEHGHAELLQVAHVA